MNSFLSENFKYSIFDPTGNITALVESQTDISCQPLAADIIMRKHPEVEQVGFLRFDTDVSFQAELRMAGGEFCGNAAMCTAAFYYMRQKQKSNQNINKTSQGYTTIRIKVSGTSSPVIVCLKETNKSLFQTGILMPPTLSIKKTPFEYNCMSDILPVVKLEGISHVIIEPDSSFFSLKENAVSAESAIRKWCNTESCLGLMFLEKSDDNYKLTPLVYVPGSGTVFWENSCASGSAAVGMYLKSKTEAPIELTLLEPGGALIVKCKENETWLYGSIRFLTDSL